MIAENTRLNNTDPVDMWLQELPVFTAKRAPVDPIQYWIAKYNGSDHFQPLAKMALDVFSCPGNHHFLSQNFIYDSRQPLRWTLSDSFLLPVAKSLIVVTTSLTKIFPVCVLLALGLRKVVYVLFLAKKNKKYIFKFRSCLVSAFF